jgi:hypothetical protein
VGNVLGLKRHGLASPAPIRVKKTEQNHVNTPVCNCRQAGRGLQLNVLSFRIDDNIIDNDRFIEEIKNIYNIYIFTFGVKL